LRAARQAILAALTMDTTKNIARGEPIIIDK
jgi:hypothetical protein